MTLICSQFSGGPLCVIGDIYVGGSLLHLSIILIAFFTVGFLLGWAVKR